MKVLNSASAASACLALLGWAVQPALAIAEDKYDAPAKENKAAWWCILYAAVFLVASVVVAFKNARRTHLD